MIGSKWSSKELLGGLAEKINNLKTNPNKIIPETKIVLLISSNFQVKKIEPNKDRE
jgi:hypothetical protein